MGALAGPWGTSWMLTVVVHHSGLLLAAVHREPDDLYLHEGVNDLGTGRGWHHSQALPPHPTCRGCPTSPRSPSIESRGLGSCCPLIILRASCFLSCPGRGSSELGLKTPEEQHEAEQAASSEALPHPRAQAARGLSNRLQPEAAARCGAGSRVGRWAAGQPGSLGLAG